MLPGKMRWLPFLVLLRALDPDVAQPLPPAPDPDSSGFAERLGFGAEATFASTYMFRGEMQYRNGTTPSFQPSLWVSLDELGPGELELGLWSAIAMADWDRINARGSATEVDLSLVYRASLFRDRLLLAGGFFYYIYPQGSSIDGEKEIFAKLALGQMPVTPSVALWTEVHPGLGVHIEPRLSWEQELESASIFAALSIGASIYRDEEATLDHSTLSLGVEQGVGPLTCAVSLSYTIQLAAGQGSFMDRSLIYGAVGFRYER